jgi:hypothetical protein
LTISHQTATAAVLLIAQLSCHTHLSWAAAFLAAPAVMLLLLLHGTWLNTSCLQWLFQLGLCWQ